MNQEVKKQQGFTIIELTLAMTFISFLLLGIAMTMIQIGAIYNKGTTSKEINQTSRELNSDLTRNLTAAGTLTLSEDYVPRLSASTEVGGRLCLGSYSYIWNYARITGTSNTNLTRYESDTNKPISLVKVEDPAKLYCRKSDGALVRPNIVTADTAKSQELLNTGDRELGLHKFGFITPVPATAKDASTGQQIYSLTYTIGTSEILALNDTQTGCKAPGQTNADPLYCNVQQFTLVVRVGNGVN